MEQRMIKRLAIVFTLVLCIGIFSGCKDESIKEETIAIVNDKTDEALDSYKEIEMMVKDYSLVADESFTGMKDTLADMSARVKKRIKETTEEDGQLTIRELDRIIDNLKEIKIHVREMVAK